MAAAGPAGIPPQDWAGWAALADMMGMEERVVDAAPFRARQALKLSRAAEEQRLAGAPVDMAAVEARLLEITTGEAPAAAIPDTVGPGRREEGSPRTAAARRSCAGKPRGAAAEVAPLCGYPLRCAQAASRGPGAGAAALPHPVLRGAQARAAGDGGGVLCGAGGRMLRVGWQEVAPVESQGPVAPGRWAPG